MDCWTALQVPMLQQCEVWILLSFSMQTCGWKFFDASMQSINFGPSQAYTQFILPTHSLDKSREILYEWFSGYDPYL